MHSWIHLTILLLGAFSHLTFAQQNRWLNPTTNLMNGIYVSTILNSRIHWIHCHYCYNSSGVLREGLLRRPHPTGPVWWLRWVRGGHRGTQQRSVSSLYSHSHSSIYILFLPPNAGLYYESAIRDGKRNPVPGYAVTRDYGILSSVQYRTFWIQVKNDF